MPTLVSEWTVEDNGAFAVDGAGRVYATMLSGVHVFSAMGQRQPDWIPTTGLGRPVAGMHIDYSNGRFAICAASPQPARILKYDMSRQLTHEFEEQTTRTNYYYGDYVAIDAAGAVYVLRVDEEMLIKYNVDGDVEWQWPPRAPDSPGGQISGGIAVGPNRVVYVAEMAKHRVLMFAAMTGRYLGSFGEFGDGPGQFNWPFGLAIDQDRVLYVAELNGLRIQKLTLDGEFLAEIPTGEIPGRRPKNVLTHPGGIHVFYEGDDVGFFRYEE